MREEMDSFYLLLPLLALQVRLITAADRKYGGCAYRMGGGVYIILIILIICVHMMVYYKGTIM